MVLISCCSSGEAATVEGVVVSADGPVAGAVVKAYASLQDALADNRPLRAASGEKPGFFRIDLPAGKYFLTAAGGDKNKRFFAYHGANPVTISDKPLWLPFAASPLIPPVQITAASSGISGTVIYKGKPVRDAQVSLYSISDKNIRGLGLQTKSTDSTGSFSLATPPGSYLLVARKRLNGKDRMPLKKGDLFCFYGANPLMVTEGHAATVEIHCHPKDDQLGFLGPEMAIKKTSHDLERFRERIPVKQEMGIAGRVVTPDGKPVENMQVTAYKREPGKTFQMQHLRLASKYMAMTDRDGRYSLQVGEAGSYYLVARQHSGESPLKGEFYGLYEGNNVCAVDIAAGVVSADITVGRVLEEASSVEPHLVYSRPEPSISKAPPVIERDTVWSGEVIVEGAVLVSRKATLRIAPGTVIRFRRIDKDGDGVGDGEIRVLGRIVAMGTAENPISFMSAEAKPRPGDWSYILLFTASGTNIIEHSIIEHAFTGLQVHFSRAVVSNSTFRQNMEGIRFGRAEIDIEQNEIINNEIGIRYHRLEGPVKIKRNVISKNGTGIFLVPSLQNIVNFSVDTYNPDNRYFMQPLVTGNIIADNLDYNFKLGERLATDVPAGGNWWGSSDEAQIRNTVFDRERDPELGRLRLAPIMPGYLSETGPTGGGRR